MPSEPDWLTADQLLALNQKVVESTGEPFGILKPNELESAAARPRHLWLYDEEHNIAALAVRLMMAVARDHPFRQGNKRTGFIAAGIFLEANGWILAVPDDAKIAELIEACIEDDRLEGALVELFQGWLDEIS